MVRKLLIVCVLALCAAIYVAELSGHWDQRIQDTNDEAAVVAIVLCVGAALLVAAARRHTGQPDRRVSQFRRVNTHARGGVPALDVLTTAYSPPTPLRI